MKMAQTAARFNFKAKVADVEMPLNERIVTEERDPEKEVEDCCPTSRCENGLYFITNGRCVIKNHDDGYISKHLHQGDYFGEGDSLKVIDYTFYGEIIADSDDVECWFIPVGEFWKIPLFE